MSDLIQWADVYAKLSAAKISLTLNNAVEVMAALNELQRQIRKRRQLRPTATPAMVRVALRELRDFTQDDLRCDDDAELSLDTEAAGLWVQCWCWVPAESFTFLPDTPQVAEMASPLGYAAVVEWPAGHQREVFIPAASAEDAQAAILETFRPLGVTRCDLPTPTGEDDDDAGYET